MKSDEMKRFLLVAALFLFASSAYARKVLQDTTDLTERAVDVIDQLYQAGDDQMWKLNEIDDVRHSLQNELTAFQSLSEVDKLSFRNAMIDDVNEASDLLNLI